jgi:D-glycero-D-manno-heptose 1,7-bisphosphate phosphatase
MLEQIHRKMKDSIRSAGGELRGIFVCPHRPNENCNCRKPKPGLLRQIEEAYSCNLTGQPAIGDSYRDLEAAIAVGAKPVLVRTGNGRITEKSLTAADRVAVFDDLAAAANALIQDEAN